MGPTFYARPASLAPGTYLNSTVVFAIYMLFNFMLLLLCVCVCVELQLDMDIGHREANGVAFLGQWWWLNNCVDKRALQNYYCCNFQKYKTSIYYCGRK